MDLKKSLLEYRAITLDILEEIDGYGDIISLVNERDKILKEIKDANFSKEEIKEIVKEIGILELDEELTHAVKKEKVKVKAKIAKLNKVKSANMKYTSSKYNTVPTLIGYDRLN